MNIEKMKSALFHAVGKCITVGGTIFLSNGGMDLFITYVEAPTGTNFLPLKAVSLLAAYAIFSKGIIPFFESLAEKQTTAGKAKNKVEVGQYFNLV